jgi:hypothetical protein
VNHAIITSQNSEKNDYKTLPALWTFVVPSDLHFI